ncbi:MULTISPECIES: hypothetical protein [unclassified Streptomyces]|uniref:hypothetical protein n=1 Tax=unclassified Streptomyces TaxID=2593676 RepID=UPI0035E09B9C
MPEPAGLRRLTDDTVIEAGPGHPVRWAPLGATDTAGTVCAAKGHEAVIAASPRELARVLDSLLSGKRVLVGDLLSGFRPSRTAVPEDTMRLPAAREGVRRLLERLESFRGLTRVTTPGA